jgi:hypothetical protein
VSEHRPITLDDVAKMAAAGHSVFSPSSSKMWLTCSGSLIPNVLSHDSAGEEAAEGTTAHFVAETWLTSGERPDHLLGTINQVDGWDIEITEEMMAYVGDYVDYVEALRDQAEEFQTETRVDFSNLTPIPDQGGTADNIAIVPIDHEEEPEFEEGDYEIVVTDLKYGKGVRVIAEGNSQGKLYAYGSYRIYRDKYRIVRIRIRICHPRLEGGITETTLTVDELKDFARYVRERAHDAWQFDAPRTPSEDGCQWCKIKGTCPALYQHIAEVTSGAFDDEDEFVPRSKEVQVLANEQLEDDLGEAPFRFVDPVRLSTPALAKVLRYRKVTEQFFAQVEETLLDRAISLEEEVPGWKVVQGRTRRKWPDDEIEVYKFLRRQGLKDGAIYDQVILSPAQAEEKLHAKLGLPKKEAKAIVDSLAFKPPGPKSLARASDNRPALASDADAFEDDDEFVPRKRRENREKGKP